MYMYIGVGVSGSGAPRPCIDDPLRGAVFFQETRKHETISVVPMEVPVSTLETPPGLETGWKRPVAGRRYVENPYCSRDLGSSTLRTEVFPSPL